MDLLLCNYSNIRQGVGIRSALDLGFNTNDAKVELERSSVPAIAHRVALPIESLQHPLAVYDELLEVFA